MRYFSSIICGLTLSLLAGHPTPALAALPQSEATPQPVSPSPVIDDMSAPIPLTLPAPPAQSTRPSLPGAPIANLKQAEKIIERFELLHQMAVAGLIDHALYERWAQQNGGAFLLLTMAPASQGLAAHTPRFEQVKQFLDEMAKDRADIAAVERNSLLDSLMQWNAARALPQNPPGEARARQAWLSLLDRLAAEELLPADQIAAEKAALALTAAP